MNKKLGCNFYIMTTIIVTVLIIFINNKIDTNEEENKEIKYWSKPTIDYFKNFDCGKLKYDSYNFKIKKFFIIQSMPNERCKYYKIVTEKYDMIAKLKKYHTRKINEANAIIWINIYKGAQEGTYTNGSKAYRLIAEINFIDKNKNTVYKKTEVQFKGSPLEEIHTNRASKQEDEYFGDRPNEEIQNIIENEILN